MKAGCVIRLSDARGGNFLMGSEAPPWTQPDPFRPLTRSEEEGGRDPGGAHNTSNLT